MTLAELLVREQVRETLASYNLAGDRLHRDAFLACFAEDALYWSSEFRLLGRAAIGQWLDSLSARPSPVRLVRHHLTTCHITVEHADEARVRSYYLALTERSPDHGGVYVDRFRQVGERWLIAERDVRLDWRGPTACSCPPRQAPSWQLAGVEQDQAATGWLRVLLT